MIEEAEYVVRITLTTTIGFSPIERDGPLTEKDAIGNAFATVTYGEDRTIWDVLESEGWTIEAQAEKV